MSMDYLKKVYVPNREETRKVTSYGQMNKWQDYTIPLSKQARPRNKNLNLNENIDVGVELQVPSPDPERRKAALERKKNRLDELWDQVEKGNKSVLYDNPLRTRKNKSSFGMYLPPANFSNELPTIANGRIVKPDPMTISAPVHLGYGESSGYDDYHRTYLRLTQEGVCPSYPLYGPPRLHYGKVGGTWKHVRNVLQAKGNRTVFVDGTPRWLENNKIMNNEVPGTSIMYPVSLRNRRKAMTHPYKIGHEETTAHKEAMKQTEGGNWNLMR